MLSPLFSVVVAVTLLPAALASFGPRLDKHRMRSDDKASHSWTRWAELIVRRRWTATAVAGVLLALLLFSASQLQLGVANADSLAQSGDAKVGLETLKS